MHRARKQGCRIVVFVQWFFRPAVGTFAPVMRDVQWLLGVSAVAVFPVKSRFCNLDAFFCRILSKLPPLYSASVSAILTAGSQFRLPPRPPYRVTMAWLGGSVADSARPQLDIAAVH